MKLEIQVVLRVSVVVGDYEVSKQSFHQFEFYGDDLAFVVVVDPFSTKETNYLVAIE